MSKPLRFVQLPIAGNAILKVNPTHVSAIRSDGPRETTVYLIGEEEGFTVLAPVDEVERKLIEGAEINA
jgi:hypothetical protein